MSAMRTGVTSDTYLVITTASAASEANISEEKDRCIECRSFV